MHPHAPAPPETSLPRLPPLAWPGPAQAARAPRADMTIWVFDKGLEYKQTFFWFFLKMQWHHSHWMFNLFQVGVCGRSEHLGTENYMFAKVEG